MGDSMFSTLTYQLVSKNTAQTLEILQKARMKLEWAINREQNLKTRQEVNLQKIVDTKKDFFEKFARNKTQTIDLTVFKEKYNRWLNKDILFQIVALYATNGLFSAEQLNSSHYLMLHFITTEASRNLKYALIEGLVTIDDLNQLCRWSKEHGTDNDDYLRYFLCDNCIELTQKGLFSIEDVYAFESPHELLGYIKEQAKNLTVNIGTQNHQSSSKESEVEPKVSQSDQLVTIDSIEPSILQGNGSTLDQRDDIKPQNNSRKAISKKEFADILNAYKSKSFLSYLSSFWLFSWISPTRSQTMRELERLLLSPQNENSVSRDQIEEAINKGDNKTYRLRLFQDELERIKTTGTDDVIVQLKEALKKTP
jgi:hypothetical protein